MSTYVVLARSPRASQGLTMFAACRHMPWLDSGSTIRLTRTGAGVSAYGTNVLEKVTQQARTGYFGGFGIDRYTPGRPQEFGVESPLRF